MFTRYKYPDEKSHAHIKNSFASGFYNPAKRTWYIHFPQALRCMPRYIMVNYHGRSVQMTGQDCRIEKRINPYSVCLPRVSIGRRIIAPNAASIKAPEA